MKPISEPDIRQRISRDNPWWGAQNVSIPENKFPRRVYFSPFKKLALNFSVKRATVLLGPRRVGKTVMIKQLIKEAIDEGVSPQKILYASIDAPVYSGISLEQFLDLLPSRPDSDKQGLVIFDEIQYLKDWETHLKDLVDTYSNIKFVVTGSAAAALRLKSRESGAGRFSEFMLPPLTFFEFLQFTGKDDELIEVIGKKYRAKDIEKLNASFLDYLNYGGYPEAVLNEAIRTDPEQFIRNDIIDKVLLKDLPSLYGISEIQELNRLFSFLAYNAGNEASLENISQESGLAKPTIKKYIEYLESAFLIIKISTVNDNCRKLQRERNFKIYLNNPSMRAALFAPLEADNSTEIGHLAECAVFSQWQHSTLFDRIRYARWKNEGEVDVIYLSASAQYPQWIGEIKWSDRISKDFINQTRHLTHFIKQNKRVKSAFFTTKTISMENAHLRDEKVNLNVMPTAVYAYTVGRNITAYINPEGPTVSIADASDDEELTEEDLDEE